MAQAPIFVVGPSRSGTGLMRTVLNQHPSVHLAPETHYFDDLRPKVGGGQETVLDEAAARRCEDYFLALMHRPYNRGGRPEDSPVSRSELSAAAEAAGGGPDGHFEAFCRMQAASRGKPRWGEKTPRHVFRVADILRVYPEAKFVCMVRDPRAVVSSYRRFGDRKDPARGRDVAHRAALERARDRASRSNDIVVTSLLWRASVQAALHARRRFGAERVRLQSFEQLVTDPGHAVRALADWLDLEFHPSMLDVPLRNSSFSPKDQRAGFSKGALARWRRELADGEIALIQSVCGGLMQRHGYHREAVAVPRARLLLQWLRLPFAVWRSTSANRFRAGRLAPYIWRRLRLAVSG